MLLGAHESTQDGLFRAVERAKKDNCECIQIFTKSPQMWRCSPLKEKDIEKFKSTVKKLNIKPNVSHASYLINLAKDDEGKRKFAVKNLIIELKRAEQLGLYGVVVHPGSNKDKKQGINNIIKSINEALSKTEKINLFIENIAGSGNWIGSKFEELAQILNGVKKKSRFGFCFDTCHAWVAGYDIKNKHDKVFDDFEKIVGLKWIKCFHLNDAVYELNSKKDRHAHIGKGFIGLKGFRKLVNNKKFTNIPGYLETRNEYKENIRILKGLMK